MYLPPSIASETRRPPYLAGSEDDGLVTLVARAKSGDRKAYIMLYRQYLHEVYRYSLVRLGNQEAAEDATQTVFVRALAAFIGWLFAIARSVVADQLRARRHQTDPNPDDAVWPAANLTEALRQAEPLPFAVVASMGVDDEDALAALHAGSPYVALVASPKRAAVVRETVTAMGVTADALNRLRAPAGLDIGAETQEEIALSIMTQIAMTRSALPQGIAAALIEAADPGIAQEAIDPICNMTVAIAGAHRTSEYSGRTWYLCCAGCKRKFEADPARYAAA